MNSRLAVSTAVGVLLMACSGDRPSSAAIERDSAGVTIVESLEPLWGEGEGWRLSEQPVVIIGAEDGPEEYSLYRVAAALRLPDTRIVIANTGTDQLRYYDSSGSFLHSVGQDGYGPGEFKIMRGVWLVADSLVVRDDGQDRVSVFSASGEYGRTLMLHREPGSNVHGTGVFSDGSMLGVELVIDRNVTPESGFRLLRVNSVYRRYSPDGAVLDSIGMFLFVESVMEAFEGPTDPTTGVAYGRGIASGAPFGRSATTIAHGNHVYHGSSDAYEIQVFTKEGTLERIIRRPIPNPPITQRDKERFRDFWLEDNGDWGRRHVLDLEFPDTKPAYGAVKVDALGNVWVAGFSFGNLDRSGNWTVFDPDGRMLGVVRVPSGGRIRDIGEDYLMGVWRTELDVEQVKMYRLFRH